jgi:hypothetical protein
MTASSKNVDESSGLTLLAEDYYAADYPEDEVASDDEYGRNVHQYQHDASDQEELDSEGVFSDEEESLQRPWKRHPWK